MKRSHEGLWYFLNKDINFGEKNGLIQVSLLFTALVQ